jgi:hypothetical protein
LIRRWEIARDGKGGFRHLPAAGGVGDQPARLMEALDLFELEFLRARPKR